MCKEYLWQTYVNNSFSGFHLAYLYRKWERKLHKKNADPVPEFSHVIVRYTNDYSH